MSACPRYGSCPVHSGMRVVSRTDDEIVLEIIRCPAQQKRKIPTVVPDPVVIRKESDGTTVIEFIRTPLPLKYAPSLPKTVNTSRLVITIEDDD